MKIAALGITLGFFIVHAVSATEKNDPPVGLADYVLNQSISEAKSIPIEGIKTEQRYRLVCSGEANAPLKVALSEAEQSEGLIKCVPAYERILELTRRSMGYTSSAQKFGQMYLDPTFFFVDDKLIKITASGSSAYASLISDALEVKYGAPIDRADGLVTNGFGVKIAQKSVQWELGNHIVWLMSPVGNIDNMMVIYADRSVSEPVFARIRAKAAASTGI